MEIQNSKKNLQRNQIERRTSPVTKKPVVKKKQKQIKRISGTSSV